MGDLELQIENEKKKIKNNNRKFNVLHKFWKLSAFGCPASVIAIPITLVVGTGVGVAAIVLVVSMGTYFVTTVKCGELLDNIDKGNACISRLEDELNQINQIHENVVPVKDNNVNNVINYDTIENIQENNKVKVRTLKKNK